MQTITRKKILHKSDIEYVGKNEYVINHVLGCSHGCKYCYAFQIAKRFGWVKDYADWCNPKLVENAVEMLKTELSRMKKKPDRVYMSFMTDPFPRLWRQTENRRIHQISLKLLQDLNVENIPVTTLSKGFIPVELLNIMTDLHPDNEYGISLISLDEVFKLKYEPYTTSYETRISAIKALHAAGYKTWVSIEPFGLDIDSSERLISILNEINFVDKIVFGGFSGKRLTRKEHDLYNILKSMLLATCHHHNIKLHIKANIGG